MRDFKQETKQKVSPTKRHGQHSFSVQPPSPEIAKLKPIRPKPQGVSHTKSYSLFYDKAPRQVEYVPYNMSDYKKIKEKPLRLGGLGPVRIGSEDW